MHTVSILRLILILSLTISTALAPIAKAANESDGPDLSEVTPARFHEALRALRTENLDWMQGAGSTTEDREAALKTLQKGLDKKLALAAAQQIADAGQTIILVGVSVGVQSVIQELQKERLEGKSIDSKHLEQLSLAAVERLLADGGLYTCIVSSGIFGAVGEKPLKVLKALLENEGSRKIFAGLLQSGISSFISAAGWEAGSALWNQAIHLIPNSKDFERSKNLIGVLTGAAHGNANDKRILGLLANNLGQILLFNDDLRTMWLYNTWRLHIATGKFVVQVSSMAAAGAIGTALFPGAGTLVGMMFGAVGGFIPNLVPDAWKEGITDELRTIRSSSNEERLQEDRAQITAWLEQGLTASADDFDGILKMQTSMRAHVMTAFSEADYKRRITAQALELEVATAKQTLSELKSGSRQIAVFYSSKPQDLEQSLKRTIYSDTSKLAQLKSDIKKVELEMRDFYSSEIADMTLLMKAASRAGSDNIATALKSEIDSLYLVLKSLSEVVAEGASLKDRELFYWIQASNFRGFEEDRLIKALKVVKP